MNTDRFILSSDENGYKKSGRYICCMHILSLIVINLFLIASIAAQDTAESLTDEFSRLSAKARTRLAKKEAAEATADVQFQNLMLGADSLFQIGEYYTSLDVYEQARTRRPLNVHPKVKIQDLQALIESEEGMNGELDDTENELPLQTSDLNAPSQTEQEIDKIDEEVFPSEEEEIVSSEEDAFQNIVEGSKPDLTSRTIDPTAKKDHPKELVDDEGSVPLDDKVEAKFSLEPKDEEISKYDGITQDQELKSNPFTDDPTDFDIGLEDSFEKEVYKEANAVISKLTVTKSGNVDVYKKVYHQWGSVFYFKNGLAVTERMWKDETHTYY